MTRTEAAPSWHQGLGHGAVVSLRTDNWSWGNFEDNSLQDKLTRKDGGAMYERYVITLTR
jgi:hypothetical protein